MELHEAIIALRNKLTSRTIWAEIQILLHSKIVNQFDEARLGGTSRGQHWDYFKTLWYKRSDGSEVPIWGGVEKLNGKGKVKAKLRSKNPEGKKRYHQGDALMQSTGIMRGALLSDLRMSLTEIELNTPVKYAIFQNALRPWNFITEEESSLISSSIARQLNM